MKPWLTVASVVLLGGVGATLGVGQPPPDAGKAAEKVPGKGKASAPVASPHAPTLDEVVASAVRGNPDVAIAEAEVQLAQARLNAVRHAAAQKVTALRGSMEDAELHVAQATMVLEESHKMEAIGAAQLDRLGQLRKAGQAVSAELEKAQQDVQVARLRRYEAEKELKQARLLQARLRAEWERLAERITAGGVKGTTEVQSQAAIQALEQFARMQDYTELRHSAVGRALSANYVSQLAGSASRASTALLPGGLADQLRSALATRVSLSQARLPFQEAVDKALAGASLKIRVKTPQALDPKHYKQPPLIEVPAADMPLGSWLQLFTDELADQLEATGNHAVAGRERHDLYVREYGLLLTTPDKAPPGALPLAVFWKQPPPTSAPPASGK